MYPDLDPKMEEINRLFAQMDILQQKLIKICSRDTLICESFLGSGTPTPPGVEFRRTKIRFYPAGHKKMEKQQWARFAGASLYGVGMKFLKKSKDSRWTV